MKQQVAPGSGDIDAPRHDRLAAFRLLDAQRPGLVEELGEVARAAHMHDDEDRRRQLGGQAAQQALESMEAAGGGADGDDVVVLCHPLHGRLRSASQRHRRGSDAILAHGKVAERRNAFPSENAPRRPMVAGGEGRVHVAGGINVFRH